MKRVLVTILLASVNCAVASTQNAYEQQEATPTTAVGPTPYAERLSAKGQAFIKEWFRLPSLQNRLNQPRRSSVDMFVVSGQVDQSTGIVLFEGRFYIVTGDVAVPMVGGGWCWESSDLQERLARLRQHLATERPSWPPLPRK